MSIQATAPRAVSTGRRRFRWNVSLLVGSALMIVAVAAAIIFPPIIAGAANDLTSNVNADGSADHWFGTDSLGRDWLARTLVAARLTLIMTAAATLLSIVAGVVIGAGLWLMPRWVREPGLRILEMVTAYPGLILALIIATILGPGAVSIVIAIAIANTLTIARLAANLAASISHQDYVVQARLLGVRTPLLLWRHVLPNMAEPILLVSSTMFALTLMEISGLSFLGLGVQLPDYDLGRLLNEALPSIYTRPLAVIAPALAISLIAFAAMLIGDGLAGIADPRSASTLAAARARRTGTPSETAAAVVVENLSISTAGGTRLVDGVSLTVGNGETVGLVGESGSGKSLTALAIARLLPDGLALEATRLEAAGLDMIGSPPARELARSVGLVYQDPGTTFSPVRPLGAQLADPLVRHQGMSRRDAKAHVIEALDTVRIVSPEKASKKRPYGLSGGMLQRAMIASAISLKPSVIIADEPTTALDVTVQREVLRELKRRTRETGTSMLFISHDIAVVEAICDRVIVMKDGRIVEVLTADQLSRRDVTSDYTRLLLDSVPQAQRPEADK